MVRAERGIPEKPNPFQACPKNNLTHPHTNKERELMKKTYKERILGLMKVFREREILQIPEEDAKFTIIQVFGDDRAKVSQVFKHLQRLGYLIKGRFNIMQINHEIEELYITDEFFFLGKKNASECESFSSTEETNND